MTVVSWKERSGEFGVVVEEASRWRVEPEELYYRQVIFVTDADDRISDHVVYCPGEWDKATVERQKAEAPMVRP